jgi:ring-1,2-phenylacetyl-CoA epoxidase subunit PaaE
MQELQTQAAGLTMQVTLDGRTRRVAVQCRGRQHPRQRPPRRAARALRLQGRRLRHLPRPRHQGEVEMAARYGLSDEEIAAGYVLTCQSVPKGEGVEVDYDA